MPTKLSVFFGKGASVKKLQEIVVNYISTDSMVFVGVVVAVRIAISVNPDQLLPRRFGNL